MKKGSTIVTVTVFLNLNASTWTLGFDEFYIDETDK